MLAQPARPSKKCYHCCLAPKVALAHGRATERTIMGLLTVANQRDVEEDGGKKDLLVGDGGSGGGKKRALNFNSVEDVIIC